jgi:hypothetical protein
MNTSNYSRSASNPNAVSIAGKCPYWYTGREYKDLAPKYWFFKEYKDGNITCEEYVRLYYEEVLNKLDAKKVYADLGNGAVILCWEGKPPSSMSREEVLRNKKYFCHRHIVAEWLEKELGINVVEV